MNREKVEQQLGTTEDAPVQKTEETVPAKTPRTKAEERQAQLQQEQQQIQGRLQQLRQAVGQLEQALLVNVGALQETQRVLEWLSE